MSKDNGLIIGCVLIGAAWLVATRGSSGFSFLPGMAAPTTSTGGAGSMPGSVGTGAKQILGGLLGNMFAPSSGGGTLTGAPPTTPDWALPSVSNSVMNNMPVPDDTEPLPPPEITFDPTSGQYFGSD